MPQETAGRQPRAWTTRAVGVGVVALALVIVALWAGNRLALSKRAVPALSGESGALFDGFLQELESSSHHSSLEAAAADFLAVEDAGRSLATFLDRGDAKERAEAAAVLGLGPAPPEVRREVLPGLGKALQDEHWRVRANAAVALGKLGEGDHVVQQALLTAHEDQDPRVRAAATFALAEAGGPPSETLAAFEAALSDPIPDVRVVAANAIVQAGNPAGVHALAGAVRDPHPEVRRAAYRSLQLTGAQAAPAIPALMDALEVERVHPTIAREALLVILGALGTASPDQELLEAMVERADILVEALGESRMTSVSRALAGGLARIVRWLEPEERGALVPAFARVYPRTTIHFREPFLALAGIASPGPFERGTLGRANTASLLERLEHEDPTVRWAAVSGLGERGLTAAIPSLAEALGDVDPAVALAAARSLAEQGAESLPAVEERLGDGPPQARILAAYVVGRVWEADRQARQGADALSAHLVAMAEDESLAFHGRQAAACALATLTEEVPCNLELLLDLPGRPAPRPSERRQLP
jgi:HEAT repeat protein